MLCEDEVGELIIDGGADIGCSVMREDGFGLE